MINMALEELKAKYQALADTCEKRGHMYYDDAEDAKQKGNCESAMQYYNMASAAFNEATIYVQLVTDLIKATK